MTTYEPVIGLETHAELLTASKMFCACPVVDVTSAPPNSAVCPICAGMPGTLPVINRRAVEYALRVAIALDCEIFPTSIFARKNYFYPDLPKGYQISQYEEPLARHGKLTIRTSQGEKEIRIRRVHLEEDTGKSVHVEGIASEQVASSEWQVGESGDQQSPNHPITQSLNYSLIDLNRSGVPLLEIVTEPDLHSPEEVSAFARALRDILVYVGVNSGDLQKGVLRVEPNISVRPVGTETLGTRTEVKNLNSFRALERAVDYEITRQISVLDAGGKIVQETVGWDEAQQITFSQRSKEEAHDYRYFPEPDLPPLVLEETYIAAVRAALPELPYPRFRRFIAQYNLSEYDADVLTTERATADYYEQVLAAAPDMSPKTVANWITGDLFALLNEAGKTIENSMPPARLGELLELLGKGSINQTIAKRVLTEMFATGQSAAEIVKAQGLGQISDTSFIEGLINEVLAANPEQVESFRAGKETVFNYLFGQTMRRAGGKANPQVVQTLLRTKLTGNS
ncbi:MAG: Asp-tRNA(Asn)/Glu-tRNA(Gln) amidotransferase subunit GatB [Anaerolineales bacterium]|nr:Asp-tRNA(Asn)/Glu-tRNA(Gln) amidotransferase subunit GatB [Anaerolineales bacterium]